MRFGRDDDSSFARPPANSLLFCPIFLFFLLPLHPSGTLSLFQATPLPLERSPRITSDKLTPSSHADWRESGVNPSSPFWSSLHHITHLSSTICVITGTRTRMRLKERQVARRGLDSGTTEIRAGERRWIEGGGAYESPSTREAKTCHVGWRWATESLVLFWASRTCGNWIWQWGALKQRGGTNRQRSAEWTQGEKQKGKACLRLRK